MFEWISLRTLYDSLSFWCHFQQIKLNSPQESTLYQISASQIMDHPSSTASAHHRDVNTMSFIKGTAPKDQAHRRQTDTNLMDQRSNTHTKSNLILQVDTQQTKTNQTHMEKETWTKCLLFAICLYPNITNQHQVWAWWQKWWILIKTFDNSQAIHLYNHNMCTLSL